MTNSQRPSAEPEEQVQLTELRPVEHSRINGDERDSQYATDGLKALRSFSRRHVEEFDCPRKRRRGRGAWGHREFGDRAKRPRGASDPATMDDGLDSDEFEEEEEEDEYYGVNGDFEYLNGNGSEVYVYRQQGSESGIDESLEEEPVPPPPPPLAEQQQEEAAEAPPAVAKRPRGRPPKKKRKLAAERKKKKVEEEEEKDKAEASSAELELQNKISDIIRANILAEQEASDDKENKKQQQQQQQQQQRRSEEQKQQQQQQKKYSCELCEARFKGSGGLRNHLKVVHCAGPLFRCDECGKEFPLKERLKLHVRTHTGFKPYKCAECGKSFARGGQLVQHRRTHSQVKPYGCELCPGRFTCAANLSLHVKRHNDQKDHKCDICGRGFVRRDALKKHLECLHRDVKSFLCSICNKTFKGHLPQHMRTHARDRPHGCATCGQRFAQKSQLTVHQRTHSGQRPFRCLVCWQAFAHSTALKLHTRRHTGERPFKCAECSAGFTQLPHWKKHMKCIHGRSEPYSCRGCGGFFRIKSELEGHEKTCERQRQQADDAGASSDPGGGSSSSNDGCAGLSASAVQRYRNMSIEKMRLLLAVLLKRISKPERLDELGFGKRLIDEVLVDSLLSAGKTALKTSELVPEFEALQANLELFLEWTVPKEHWDNFRRTKKTPEEVLEALTGT